jgi:hypothetical protein
MSTVCRVPPFTVCVGLSAIIGLGLAAPALAQSTPNAYPCATLANKAQIEQCELDWAKTSSIVPIPPAAAPTVVYRPGKTTNAAGWELGLSALAGAAVAAIALTGSRRLRSVRRPA